MQEKSIDEILLKNGFDILENGCCYTDKHRIERAMQEYGNQLVGDKEREIKELKAALKELVELKRLKDSQGKTEDYLTRQPTAWERAMQALKQPPIK